MTIGQLYSNEKHSQTFNIAVMKLVGTLGLYCNSSKIINSQLISYTNSAADR